MKTIKLDYSEFEQLHKALNEQEAVIKFLTETSGNVVQVNYKEVNLPRHCFNNADESIYDRYRVLIPILHVGEYADESIKDLAEEFETLKDKYFQLYDSGRRNLEKDIRKEVEKEIRQKIAKEKNGNKKKWWRL